MRHDKPLTQPAVDAADAADRADRARSDGYFVVDSIVDYDRCGELAARLHEYASGERRPAAAMVLQQEPVVARTGDHRPGGVDVRKIDGLYNDELFRQLIENELIASQLQPLLGPDLRLYRATALMKPPAVGSAKGLHQDAPYWPIEPMSMWSCWVALDDATLGNGCLVVLPGSHLGGPLPHHETQDDFVIDEGTVDESTLVPVPVPRGSALCFHSLLVHGSAANTSEVPRRAVTISYMGAAHRHTGPEQTFPVVAGEAFVRRR